MLSRAKKKSTLPDYLYHRRFFDVYYDFTIVPRIVYTENNIVRK